MDVKSRSISDLCTDTSDCHVAIVEVSNGIHVPIQKVLSEGSNTDGFLCCFLVDGMERIEMPLKVGHHQPASETPLKWHFASVPMMAHHW